jgi:hypothetical protein
MVNAGSRRQPAHRHEVAGIACIFRTPGVIAMMAVGESSSSSCRARADHLRADAADAPACPRRSPAGQCRVSCSP